MSKVMPRHFYKLLEQLQSVDFVLVELNLYLDTHPDDMQAIEQYNAFAQHREQLKKQYEQEFGPLLHYGQSYSRYPFEWVETPWPWQI